MASPDYVHQPISPNMSMSHPYGYMKGSNAANHQAETVRSTGMPPTHQPTPPSNVNTRKTENDLNHHPLLYIYQFPPGMGGQEDAAHPKALPTILHALVLSQLPIHEPA